MTRPLPRELGWLWLRGWGESSGGSTVDLAMCSTARYLTPMTSITDLALLAVSVRFNVSGLGAVSVDAFSDVFETWLTSGLGERRWSEGAALMVELLREHARDANDAPIPSTEIDGVSVENLNAAAAAFIEETGRYFESQWVHDRGAAPPRKRRAGERYELDAREKETECDRLLRILSDWSGDRELQRRSWATTSLTESIAAHERRMREIRDAAGLGGGLVAAIQRSSEMTLLSEAMKSATSPLVDAMKATSASMAVGRLATSFDHSGLAALSQTMQNVGLSASAAAERFAAISAVNRPLFEAANLRMAENGLAIQMALGNLSASGNRDFARIAEAASTNGVAAALQRSLGRRRLETVPFELAAGVDDRSATSISKALARASFAQPGFQLTAAVAVSGLAAPGVASDLLNHYDLTPKNSMPVFGAALDTAHWFDLDEADRSGGVADLREAFRELQAQVLREKNPVRRHSLMEILAFIATLVAAIYAGLSYYGDEAERHVEAKVQQQERLEAQDARDRAAREAFESNRYVRYIAVTGPLRAAPDAHGQVIRTVFVNELAVVTDRTGSWAKVEVFGYSGEAAITGWVPLRRLKIGGQ